MTDYPTKGNGCDCLFNCILAIFVIAVWVLVVIKEPKLICWTATIVFILAILGIIKELRN